MATTKAKTKPQTPSTSPLMEQQKSTRITRSKRGHVDVNSNDDDMNEEASLRTPAKRPRLKNYGNSTQEKNKDTARVHLPEDGPANDGPETLDSSPSGQGLLVKMPIKRRTASSPASAGKKKYRTVSAQKASTHNPSQAAELSLPLTPIGTALVKRIERLQFQSGGSVRTRTEADDFMVYDGSQSLSLLRSLRKQTDERALVNEASPHAISLDVAVKHQYDDERLRFERSISILTEEKAKQKALLDILHIELEAIVNDETKDTLTIVKDIRQALHSVQEVMLTFAPKAVRDGNSLLDIIYATSSLVQETITNNNAQQTELDTQADWISQLQDQVQGLLDRLATAEIDLQEASDQNCGLQEQRVSRDQEISRLADALEESHAYAADLSTDVETRDAQLLAADTTIDELRRGLQRLKETLHGYRDEEHRLSALITKMEDSHNKTIKQMNNEREQAVRDLDDRIDVETVARAQAEAALVSQQALVQDLQVSMGGMQSENERLQDSIMQVESELQLERDGHLRADHTSEYNQSLVAELGDRVSELEQELNDAKKALITLQQDQAEEHDRLVEAEQLLSLREDEVNRLKQSLREDGLEANRLKMKVFEAQELYAKTIADLKETAYAQAQTLQQTIDTEITKRDNLKEILEEKNSRLAEIDDELQLLTESYQDAAEELADDSEQQDHGIEEIRQALALSRGFSELGEQRQAQTDRAGDTPKGLAHTLEALKSTLLDYETRLLYQLRISEQLGRQRESQLEDEQNINLQLRDQAEEDKQVMSDMRKAITNLEGRVDHEATQMLQMELAKQDEIDALRETVRLKEEQIEDITLKARKADAMWQSAFNEKVDDLTVLENEKGQFIEHITMLEDENIRLNHEVEQLVEEVNDRVRNVDTSFGRMQQVANSWTEKIQARHNDHSEGVQDGSTVRKSRRYRDSGIVVEADNA